MMLRKIVLAALLTAVAGGTFSYLNWGKPREPQIAHPGRASTPPPTAEASSENSDASQTTDEGFVNFRVAYTDPSTGKLLYKVSADKAIPVKNSQGKPIRLEIKNPLITLYPADGAEMAIKALEGEIALSGISGADAIFLPSSETLERKALLKGDVEIETADGIKIYDVDEIHWDSLLFKIFTASPVKMKSDDFEMTGIGLETEDSMNIFNIDRDVKVLMKESGIEALGIFGGENKGDITITCKDKLILNRSANSAEFNKDVVASHANFSLASNWLKINFSKQEGSGAASLSFEEIFARENIVIKGPGYNVAGDELTYDAQKDMATITGIGKLARLWQDADFLESETIQFYPATNEIRTPTGGTLRIFFEEEAQNSKSQQIVTWKGRMRFNPGENLAHFEEDVEIDDGSSKLRCQITDILFEPAKRSEGKKEITLSKIIAEKDVSYVEAGRKISGDRLVFDKKQNIFTVYSEVESRVMLGSDTLAAQEISFDKKNEVTLAKGKGSLTLMPGESQKDKTPVQITWHEWMKFYAKNDFAEFKKSV